MSTTKHTFLSWYRKGMATLITDTASSTASHYETRVALQVNGAPVQVPIHLYGPGDVARIAPEQILRRTPAPHSRDCASDMFPSVEFRDADLPWRYTPTGVDSNNRLRPWLALIAVCKRPGFLAAPAGKTTLPVVTVPVQELPDLAEAALWAHVQVEVETAGVTPGNLSAYLNAHPERAIARLVFPRRLAPNTEYLVCLVPTFEAGRLAGLGETWGEATVKLRPAWDVRAQSAEPMKLPVYDLWTFTTGVATAGQFEALARALTPYTFPDDAAAGQPFTVDPILTGAGAPQITMTFQGALRPVSRSATSPATPPAVHTALTAWLNRAAAVEEVGGDPQVTPPLYGAAQASARQVGVPGSPTWLSELNLDPRHRIAAAAGADIVQQQQDAFVRDVWQQVGQLKEANTLLRGAELARRVSQRVQRKHFQKLPPDLLLQVSGPVQTRIPHGTGSLYKTIAASDIPAAGFESAFRRISRARGPYGRQPGRQVQPEAALLFQQGFERVPLTNWVAFDDGTTGAPSRWEEGIAGITQSSMINSPPYNRESLEMRGTFYLAGDPNWQDIRYRLSITPQDNQAVGVVFRYRDAKNYYRFSMDSARKYRRLVKCSNGKFSLLWEDGESFAVNSTKRFEVWAEGDMIRVTEGWFATTEILSVRDSTHKQGRVGLYTWMCKATFDPILFVQQGLNRNDYPGRIVDQGDRGGPSQWTTHEGDLRQNSNIHQLPDDRDSLAKLGTYIVMGTEKWKVPARDYAVDARLWFGGSDDAIGLMFRYRSPKDYYRFSMDQARSYQRLVQCVNGTFTLLWQQDIGYDPNLKYRLRIIADGSRLRGYLDTRKIFDVRNSSHREGGIACYCWGGAGAHFSDVRVQEIRHAGTIARLNAAQLGDDLVPTTPLALDDLKTTFLHEMDAQRTVSARILERVQVPTAPAVQNPLAPLRLAPQLAIPLSTYVVQQAPHLLLPGSTQVPDNTVILLETNPAFVASFLVGANHEMSRELLWRGLETDPRATVFQQFWDVRESGSPAGSRTDIVPIHTWSASATLAAQGQPSGALSQTVFLIRSELLRRFPDARFYLVKAVASSPAGKRRPGTVVALPWFRGQLAEDMVYVGFGVAPDAARGVTDKLGWYLVIEQRALAGGFGVDGPEPAVSQAANAAELAARTQRKPFRLFLHAANLMTS